MDDLISRAEAIRWVKTECNPYGKPTLEFESGKKVIEHLEQMPSAQPERLTDDDFETIRIHLNACKEKLCNQQRWEEAKEYQRIIDRFMSFASAQPEPIWGLPVSADRPLADVEIVSRLRDIQKQIPGGSYAIDRAIEIIEAVAERRADGF